MNHTDPRRVTPLNELEPGNGPIIYWMSRDQRAHDNWALEYARELAQARQTRALVVFCLVPSFLGATMRQYGFMLRGLKECARTLREHGVPFYLLIGDPEEQIPAFVREHGAGAVITDFDPLKPKRAWRSAVAKKAQCAVIEVDAHNVVPCRFVSDKQEYAAYTLRPKIHALLPEFLTPFPRLTGGTDARGDADWERAAKSLDVDTSIAEVTWLKPGEAAAHAALRRFIDERLPRYAEDRNIPTIDGQSDLSPYLHFGQISAQRIALEVQAAHAPHESTKAFLEELIVRRELADNFCWYNTRYDSTDAFPEWARKSFAAHARDPREYTYGRRALENGKTHDPLWNAAQRQMVTTGKMHGYLRMYWAKKILEWTESADEALKTAIYLNDRYELDGRDPNGYTGIAWSIGGVHDRPWFTRPIFGQIRYMSLSGMRNKFDVDAFIARYGDSAD
ncbi:deoxyribodipyrimidine photo-lyase [Patescibacteria group bacterium]|nr:deoxyribodipyrimidine photo-lyase [Patescibacteria group bacterium]